MTGHDWVDRSHNYKFGKIVVNKLKFTNGVQITSPYDDILEIGYFTRKGLVDFNRPSIRCV
jgi:hypothetical protein